MSSQFTAIMELSPEVFQLIIEIFNNDNFMTFVMFLRNQT